MRLTHPPHAIPFARRSRHFSLAIPRGSQGRSRMAGLSSSSRPHAGDRRPGVYIPSPTGFARHIAPSSAQRSQSPGNNRQVRGTGFHFLAGLAAFQRRVTAGAVSRTSARWALRLARSCRSDARAGEVQGAQRRRRPEQLELGVADPLVAENNRDDRTVGVAGVDPGAAAEGLDGRDDLLRRRLAGLVFGWLRAPPDVRALPRARHVGVRSRGAAPVPGGGGHPCRADLRHRAGSARRRAVADGRGRVAGGRKR
jgi:hypothetical protein